MGRAPERAGSLLTSAVTPGRVVLATALVAAAVYVGVSGLGFALDDDPLLRLNPVVTEGRVAEAASGPYWRLEPHLGLLWRPVTMASFAAEWGLWGGSPAGFHAVNVAVHAGVSALVAALLLAMAPAVPALVGGLLFAVHPVHVEAVANVVGRSELYAAAGFLVACLLFLSRPTSPWARVARVVGAGAAYAVALGSKEIAVTLPGALVLLALHPAAWARRGVREGESGRKDTAGSREPGGTGSGALRRLADDAPLFALLGAVLICYLVFRVHVLGSLTGELLPAELVGTTPLQRLWTALSLWPEYLRLMVFPVDLVADYGPGVLDARRSLDAVVVGGFLVLLGLAGIAALTWRRSPLVSLGILWFAVTVLPVAHLGVHAGVLLAERTLYLPSVGLVLLATGLVVRWSGTGGTAGGSAGPAADPASTTTRSSRPGSRAVSAPVFVGATAVVLGLLAARTVTRVPVWESTFVLFRELAEDHPESHRALRLYGDLLLTSGDTVAAAAAFDRAARVHPYRYPILLEAGSVHRLAGDEAAAREAFVRAVDRDPRQREAWRLLAESYLRDGDTGATRRTALEGLAHVGSDEALWTALSEAYLLEGDTRAAVRARRAAAAVAADPTVHQRRIEALMESGTGEGG